MQNDLVYRPPQTNQVGTVCTNVFAEIPWSGVTNRVLIESKPVLDHGLPIQLSRRRSIMSEYFEQVLQFQGSTIKTNE